MNKLFCRQILLSLLLPLFLAGCATTMTPATTKSQLAQNQWALQGRIAVKTPNKGESASIYWQQQGQNYSLRVFGPLGVGAMQLHGEPGDVTLVANNGQVYQATTPEALVEQTLGWQLPVSNLQYWIRGMIAPHAKAVAQYDNAHRLLSLEQQGWTINYLSYNSDDSDALPHLLVCSHQQLTLRIVIDRWSV